MNGASATEVKCVALGKNARASKPYQVVINDNDGNEIMNTVDERLSEALRRAFYLVREKYDTSPEQQGKDMTVRLKKEPKLLDPPKRWESTQESADDKFIRHIQAHLPEGEEVMCKICGESAKEICKLC